MIDARVDDAIKQHVQKMDWLRREEEAQTLTPPPAGAAGSAGKKGFTLPLGEVPQAHEVIAPILEPNAKLEGDSISQSSDIHQSLEEKRAVPAAQDWKDAASTDEEKTVKKDKTGSSPPKDGTPV